MLCNVNTTKCKSLYSCVVGRSTEGAKGVDEMPVRESECVNGDKGVSPPEWSNEFGVSEGEHLADEFHISVRSIY